MTWRGAIVALIVDLTFRVLFLGLVLGDVQDGRCNDTLKGRSVGEAEEDICVF